MHPAPATRDGGHVDGSNLSSMPKLRENQYMPTQIKARQQVTDAHGDRSPPPVHDAVATIIEQPSGAADPTLQRVQDLMGQVVREGVNISLKTLQVWADLARQRALTAQASSATAT
jgi:hypothetical protein